MTASHILRINAPIVFDGSRYVITEILDNAVVLRGAKGHYRRVDIAELLRPLPDGGRARLGDTDAPEDAGEPGILWADASDRAREAARERAAHLREALTGYRSGDASTALAGEPKTEYALDKSRGRRVKAKAVELGVSQRTLERWIGDYRSSGEFGLVDGRQKAPDGLAPSIDARWLSMAKVVLDEQINEPKVTKAIVMARIEARLAKVHDAAEVPVPGRSTAYKALAALDRGRSTFDGSTKRKRSNANRPQGAYGEIRATHPGEYVLMDTTPLNVFALSPVSGKWVSVDLTFAMDLYSRCVLGMRLSPGSTKSVDVASVLVESLYPFEPSQDDVEKGRWPYHGVPKTLIVNPDRVIVAGRFMPPPTVPQCLVTDHGSAYVSEHVTSACARLGISIQPARVYTPTDKGPVERFFRTLDSLLQELPGYKGADVASRGQDPESEAVYTLPQLEQIIREWIATVYHVRPHAALSDPGMFGVKMSPAERYSQGLAVTGELRIPRNRNYLLELLPVAKRQFNHYGVELNGIRYRGEIVAKYRNRTRGSDGDALWPFSYDPDDVRRIYFRDPEDGTWHALRWHLKGAQSVPFSSEALEHAKRLALEIADGKRPDVDAAAAKLLADWGAGRDLTPTERRVSARLASQLAENHRGDEGAWSLRTVQRMLDSAVGEWPDDEPEAPAPAIPQGGDDDDDDDLFAAFVFGDDELMEMM